MDIGVGLEREEGSWWLCFILLFLATRLIDLAPEERTKSLKSQMEQHQLAEKSFRGRILAANA